MDQITNPLTKRVLINKANQMIVVVTAVAAFIAVFSLVSSKTLLSQEAYQNRVIKAKEKAYNQVKADVTAVDNLNSSYTAFVSTPQNVLGGNPSGNGANDGDNARIVLDSLPPQYDFPALASSLAKILTGQGLSASSLSGTDEELTQQGNSSTQLPKPVAMPFSISVSGTYQQIQNLILAFQESIRPVQIQTVQLSGTDTSISLSLTAQTYYQPSKTFKITSETVK